MAELFRPVVLCLRGYGRRVGRWVAELFRLVKYYNSPRYHAWCGSVGCPITPSARGMEHSTWVAFDRQIRHQKKQQLDAICRLLTWIYFNGNKKGSKNGATVSYKTIFCGDIPLHRPYIGLIYIYMVGTSNLGSWNGHWWLNWLNTEWFQIF